MTGPALVVHDPGLHVALQDAGRDGARRWGVPRGGALDTDALVLANALVGNDHHEAALEILHGGLAVGPTGGRTRVALAGAGATLEVEGPRRSARFGPWRAVDVATDEVVRVRRRPDGPACAYLAVAGGFAVTPTLGSRSTTPVVGLGGWHGRTLRRGDVVPLRSAAPPPGPLLALPWPPGPDRSPLRVVAGPQLALLDPGALDRLGAATYHVGGESDRMGLRLDGPALPWAPPAGGEMLSDGVVPGAVQVPADGRPILLLADCQTTGGYPKVAVVCRADLARAGRLRPGDEVRFRVVSLAEAQAARRTHAAALARRAASARPVTGTEPDLRALHTANLLSGAVDAALPDPPTDAPASPIPTGARS